MRRLILAALLLALPGCALHPLYAGGGSGAVAQTLQQVAVAPIDGRNGWLVYNKLKERLGASDSGGPAYRLEVKLEVMPLNITPVKRCERSYKPALRKLLVCIIRVIEMHIKLRKFLNIPFKYLFRFAIIR